VKFASKYFSRSSGGGAGAGLLRRQGRVAARPADQQVSPAIFVAKERKERQKISFAVYLIPDLIAPSAGLIRLWA
jgi:hypothetical protein